MKRFIIFCLAVTCLSVTILWAQEKKTKSAKSKSAPRPKYPYKAVPVFLGNSTVRGGVLPKSEFDSLAAQGLTAIDSAGITGKVIEFRIYYKERNLYEDSVGNYYYDFEMLNDFSKGNQLNTYVDMKTRSKKGDTAIFDDIVVMMSDSMKVHGLPMHFVIGK